MKEKTKDNKPKVAAKPWAWVKEANRARVEKGMECRVTFSREEGQAVRNSSFYEGVVTGVNDDKTFLLLMLMEMKRKMLILNICRLENGIKISPEI